MVDWPQKMVNFIVLAALFVSQAHGKPFFALGKFNYFFSYTNDNYRLISKIPTHKSLIQKLQKEMKPWGNYLLF